MNNIKTEKPCAKCGKVKDLSEFAQHKRMNDGRKNKCRECTSAEYKQKALLEKSLFGLL